MTEQQAKDLLKTEGFEDMGTVTFEPNILHPEHTHDRHTLQLITQGELTVKDKTGSKIYKEGDRLESPAGTTHSAVAGPEGCTFVVGMK
jgi:quercetin dioxygenase-like cupin family protein